MRDYFLRVDATELGTKSQPSALSRVPAAAIPARFALRQNQPNPFQRATTIRFELPVGAMVKLEVFDLSGRRVTTLANHYYPPGYHVVEWDQRDGAGDRARPGVYFYRIEAGPFRSREKMVLLP